MHLLKVFLFIASVKAERISKIDRLSHDLENSLLEDGKLLYLPTDKSYDELEDTIINDIQRKQIGNDYFLKYYLC